VDAAGVSPFLRGNCHHRLSAAGASWNYPENACLSIFGRGMWPCSCDVPVVYGKTDTAPVRLHTDFSLYAIEHISYRAYIAVPGTETIDLTMQQSSSIKPVRRSTTKPSSSSTSAKPFSSLAGSAVFRSRGTDKPHDVQQAQLEKNRMADHLMGAGDVAAIYKARPTQLVLDLRANSKSLASDDYLVPLMEGPPSMGSLSSSSYAPIKSSKKELSVKSITANSVSSAPLRLRDPDHSTAYCQREPLRGSKWGLDSSGNYGAHYGSMDSRLYSTSPEMNSLYQNRFTRSDYNSINIAAQSFSYNPRRHCRGEHDQGKAERENRHSRISLWD
jgi:hypothetical protein